MKDIKDILRRAVSAGKSVTESPESKVLNRIKARNDLVEAAHDIVNRIEELEYALGMTYFFKEFTEEWADLTNSDVVLFMKLRDEALCKAYLSLLDSEKVSEWISVKDRLPDRHEECLVYVDYDEMYISIFDAHVFERRQPWHKVTHWKPLPEPPKVIAHTQNEPEAQYVTRQPDDTQEGK